MYTIFPTLRSGRWQNTIDFGQICRSRFTRFTTFPATSDFMFVVAIFLVLFFLLCHPELVSGSIEIERWILKQVQDDICVFRMTREE